MLFSPLHKFIQIACVLVTSVFDVMITTCFSINVVANHDCITRNSLRGDHFVVHIMTALLSTITCCLILLLWKALVNIHDYFFSFLYYIREMTCTYFL